MHTKMKTNMMHNLVAFILLIICFYIWFSHVMMHKGQFSHIYEVKLCLLLYYLLQITNWELQNATVRAQCAQKSEQPSEAHRTVKSTCPVPLEDKAPTVIRARTLTVG
jgi:hypothetical protein